MNDLQRELHARRRKLRLSYPKLAALTGIAQSTVWNIFNGPMKDPPGLDKIELLNKALDWPPGWLHQLVGEQFGYHFYTVESRDLQIVMASWEELSERDRRTIVRMVEELRRDANNDAE